MKICVIGTGYVGLVSGACFADVGNHVWCVDKDEAKISKLQRGEVPIFERGLIEIVDRNLNEKRIFFTTDLARGLEQAEICFITVDTPPDGDGRADLINVLLVAEKIGEIATGPITVVTKSTVPVGTTFKVRDVLVKKFKNRNLNPDKLVRIATNPEFLKEGSAVEDFMKPNRVIVGADDDQTAEALHALYTPFMRRRDRFVRMNIPSAELTKYASNAMLATRISFMNELARLCEKVGADINDVRNGMGSDPRIGPDFLYAGLGFGGSCFPKDTRAIIELGKEHSAYLSVIEAVQTANVAQREWFWDKISTHFKVNNGLKGKNIAIWGVAFKADTDDVREAPAIDLISKLIDSGANVNVFDPVATSNAKTSLEDKALKVRFADDAYKAVEGVDALIICTEWREFRSPDFAQMKNTMRNPVIFDGRNLYEPSAIKNAGFAYISVGRG